MLLLLKRPSSKIKSWNNILEMIFYKVYCVLILFAKAVISNEAEKKPLKASNEESVKHSFATLLNTLVKLNEERMQAVDKITKLQDYMLTKNKLKNDYETYDSMDEEDNRMLLAFTDLPLLRRSEDEAIAREKCRKFNSENDNSHIWTSQFLKLACQSHSVVSCEHACKKSFMKLCEKCHCNVNSRRNLSSECHENCSKYFKHDEV